jgi:ISXO2-like transposase domain
MMTHQRFLALLVPALFGNHLSGDRFSLVAVSEFAAGRHEVAGALDHASPRQIGGPGGEHAQSDQRSSSDPPRHGWPDHALVVARKWLRALHASHRMPMSAVVLPTSSHWPKCPPSARRENRFRPVHITPVVQSDGTNASQFFPIIHTLFSNIKAWLVGTHHAVSAKHLPRYLREWSYRFNRRNLPASLDRYLIGVLSSAPPSPTTSSRPAPCRPAPPVSDAFPQ